MKRILYATTALATVGLVAGAATGANAANEKIKLGLSGYHQQFVTAVEQDYNVVGAPGRAQRTNVVDQKHNSEVCFIGESTLDSGITVGVNVQLEANTSSDQIDESYMYVSHPQAGQLLMGDENNAGYLLHVTAPDGGISLDSGDLLNLEAFVIPVANVFDTAIGTTNLRFFDNDSGKVSYTTPRYAGFQAGISYIPEFENGGDDNSSLRAPGTGNLGRNAGIHNGWGGGLNYKNDFNGVGVQASVGAMYGDPAASGNANGGGVNLNGASTDPIVAYNTGAQVSYAGFTVGGAYSRGQGNTNTQVAGGLGQVNSWSYTVGAAYATGPYTVGVDYMYGTNNTSPNLSGRGHLTQFIVSGGYTLGPGIRLVGGVFTYDGENEGNTTENDGYGALSGFKLSF